MTIFWARWLTLAVWAAVAASAVFWGLRLFAQGPAVPAGASPVSTGTGLRGDPERLLGAAPAGPAAATPAAPPPPAAARFALLGVVAPRPAAAAAEGLALIAIDGKPARAYRVGAALEGDLVVQRVHARGVDIGVAGEAPSFALNTPPLPTATAGGAPGARPLPPPMPRVLPRPVAQPPMTVDGGEPEPTTEPEPAPDAKTVLGAPDEVQEALPASRAAPRLRPGVETR